MKPIFSDEATRELEAILLAGIENDESWKISGVAQDNDPPEKKMEDYDKEQKRVMKVRQALEDGANPDGMIGNRHYRFEQPFLSLAAERNESLVVQALLEAGADCNHIFKRTGETALHRATGSEGVAVLLRAGANPDILSKPCYYGPAGSSALHMAVRNGNSNIVKMMLKAGASPNVVDSQNEGEHMIFDAIKTEPEIVRLLINAGADVNAVNHEGKTPYEKIDSRGFGNTIDEKKETMKSLLMAARIEKGLDPQSLSKANKARL